MPTEYLLRRLVREIILREVDVLSPNDDPRQGGQSKNIDADIKQKDTDDDPRKYASKEQTRQKLQDILKKKVTNGEFNQDEDLATYLSDQKRVASDGKFDPKEDVSLAITALRGVPLSVWRQLPPK